MGRFSFPGRHRSQSWNVNNLNTQLPKSNSNWKIFKLLVWKNYKLQTRHKIQTAVEILLPTLFALVLATVRNTIPSMHVQSPTIYGPIEIENYPPNVIRTKCTEIYYSPNSTLVNLLMAKVKERYFDQLGLRYNFTPFKTEGEMVESYKQSDNKLDINQSADFEATTPVLAGVAFSANLKNVESFPKSISYKLRFPATQRNTYGGVSESFGIKPAWFTELTYPLFQLHGPRFKDSLDGGLPGYSKEGFLYLQNAVERTITRMLLDPPEVASYDKLNIKLQRFPYGPYYDDKFLIALQGWLPFIVMLSFIYVVINITKSIVHEKEKRLKEYMKMMGLNNWMHWTAWFTKCFAFLLLSTTIMTVLLKTKLTKFQELAVLANSDGTVIFFIFVMFSFQLISFSFFISSLFSDANSGAVAAGVIWFMKFVPYGFLQPQYNLLSRFTKLLSCLFTNTAVSFSCQILCMVEGTGRGCQWSTIFEAISPDDNFSLGDCLLMMILNGVLFISLALYIEAVHPGQFGVPLSWNFLFTKRYWTGGAANCSAVFGEKESLGNNPVFEQEKSNAKAGVEIRGLSKIYESGKVAVRNMSLNMYEGQTTVLLGHNGAGKTTTMNILTGLTPPSSGTAFINGHDICTSLNEVRSSLGLCPQHDILFDELTVEEHLRFFSLLKGLDESAVDSEVCTWMDSVGLESKRDAQSHTLSGGMRRKLSVGIAFCGGSKVVLLDEPSSGMDPGARRAIWDLVQREKKERTILLSTHFMEEADLLGDRIAIMAEGEVKCCGSSLFLKKKYGGGYHLIIVKEPHCKVDVVTDVLRKTLPNVEIDENVGAELSYSLPEEKSKLFPNIFEELERRKDELGIASYGCGLVTMEEIFIRVGKKSEVRASVEVNLENEIIKDPPIKLLEEETERVTGIPLKFLQFKAMLIKKCIYALRNRLLLLSQVGIPVVCLMMVLSIITYLPGLKNPPPHRFTLEKYEKLGKTVTVARCPDENEVCNSYKEYVGESFHLELVDRNQTAVDYILEKAKEDLLLLNSRYIIGFDQRKISDSDKDWTELVGLFNNQPYHAPPLSMNLITNAILRGTNHTVQLTNHPFPYTGLDALKQSGRVLTVGFQIGYNIAFGMSFLAASFVAFPVKERESKSKHLQFVSGVELPLYWLAGFLVDVVNLVVTCIGILAVLQISKLEEFSSVQLQVSLFILLISYGLAVIPLMYLCSFLFTVPSTGFTKMIMFNLVTGMATMLAVAIIQIPEFHLGYISDELNKAFLIFPNYALGMGVVQLSTNYKLSKQCLNYNLDFLCPAFPNSYCCMKLKGNYLDWHPSGIGRNVGCLLISCVAYFLLLFTYEKRFLNRLLYALKGNSKFGEDFPPDDENEDGDVLEERNKICNTDLFTLYQSNNLVLRNLTKYYSNVPAVDRISLGVSKGECFGLLGINGAGKTTTFKMLTGDLSASKGDAFVGSHSVRQDLRKVHENMGYCPQFDALLDEFTGRETIWMYARLRGLKEELIDLVAEKLAKQLLFTQHLDKFVGTYSGGNKRKLSCAVAFLSNPTIVFLDEPTSGMDPVARRHLWNAISRVRDAGTSIFLSSHSMEECEALCSRLAIMVNGRLKCIGSPQQLKSKFGEGYTLIAQTSLGGLNTGDSLTGSKQGSGKHSNSIQYINVVRSGTRWESELEALRIFIEKTFPGCTLKDIHPGYVHYHVITREATWAKMFSAMEAAKEKFKLEAYSVGQTSLEQVFLHFTKTQAGFDFGVR